MACEQSTSWLDSIGEIMAVERRGPDTPRGAARRLLEPELKSFYARRTRVETLVSG